MIYTLEVTTAIDCPSVCVSHRIVRFPWQMSEDQVQRVLQEALAVWSAVTPLKFREVTTEKADITIDFNR